MKMAYPASFATDEDGRVLVTFRDLPEAITDGADQAEAESEALDLLHSVLEFRMRDRDTIPPPSRARKGEKVITPDLDIALKASLHMAMQQNGVTIAELTRRLQVDNREAQRIVNPRHATRTHRMQEALRAAGRGVAIELR